MFEDLVQYARDRLAAQCCCEANMTKQATSERMQIDVIQRTDYALRAVEDSVSRFAREACRRFGTNGTFDLRVVLIKNINVVCWARREWCAPYFSQMKIADAS